MAARGDAIQDMGCENLRRKQKFPTERISVSYLGNFRLQRWKFSFPTLEILTTAALAKLLSHAKYAKCAKRFQKRSFADFADLA